MAQQGLRQPVAGMEDIFALVLAGSQQVTHGFLGRGRDPHRRELTGTEEAGQLAGVTAIGLDPVAGRTSRRIASGLSGMRLSSSWPSARSRATLMLALLTSRPTWVAVVCWSMVGVLRMWHLRRRRG